MTRICVSKKTIIDRRQAIIWTYAGILLIGTLGTKFSEILIEIRIFSFKKMGLKVSSAKWQPFCLGLNMLINQPTWVSEPAHVVPIRLYMWWYLLVFALKSPSPTPSPSYDHLVVFQFHRVAAISRLSIYTYSAEMATTSIKWNTDKRPCVRPLPMLLLVSKWIYYRHNGSLWYVFDIYIELWSIYDWYQYFRPQDF